MAASLNEALGDGGSSRERIQRASDFALLRRSDTMAGNLDTTNLLLGIMAVVSVLEALVIIGMASPATWSIAA